MSVPYTPAYVAAVLDGMCDEQLARVQPAAFCLWPAKHPLHPDTGRDLIAQEKAKRSTARSAATC